MSPTDQHAHGGGSRAADRPTDHRGRYVPDGSWPPGRGAPEPLERVRRFVNTANPESGADHFETPASLAAWLEREGYGRPRVTERDRTRAVLLRAAVRDWPSPTTRAARGRPPRGRGPPPARRPGRGPPARRALLTRAGAGARLGRRRRGAVEPGGHPPRRHGGRHVVPVEGVSEQPLPLGLLRPLPQQLGGVVLGAGLWEPHEGAGLPRPPAGRSRRRRCGRPPPSEDER